MKNEDLRECEKCGTLVEKRVTVADCDVSVGFHGTGQICEPCAETYNNHCGACR